MIWTLFAEMDATSLLMMAVTTLAGVLSIIGTVVWKAALWFRSEVAVPIIAEHRALISELRKAIPVQEVVLQETKQQLLKQTSSLSGIEENINLMRLDTFEHLALQRTEMVHLEEIKTNGSRVVELLLQQAADLSGHYENEKRLREAGGG